MNRIQHLTQALSSPATPLTSSVELARYSGGDDDAGHALFAPLHYETGYAYPLLVWLHGPRGDERQLKRIMPLVSMRNYVGVAPRGPVCEAAESSARGYSWRQSAEHIEQAEQRILSAIDAARHRLHINAARIFIAGFDCGGTMAFRMALNHPHQFAGALSLCGSFPTGLCPLRRLNELRSLPLFLAGGTHSECYPTEQVCDELRLFHAAGLSVTVRQYPCGDELTTLMLEDMNRWIMDQVCPAGAACESETRA